jgi:predicted PurR-regulated permease PerM
VGEPMRAPENRLRDPEERLREVVEAASEGKQDRSVGRPGRALNRRSPFFIGMSAAAGVAVTFGIVALIVRARSVLVLIGLALFIAAGLDPLVSWLCRKGLPRWAAVLVVVLALLAVGGGFIAAAVPPLAAQTTALVHHLPHYTQELKNHNSQLGRLNARYHIQQHISSLLSSKGTTLIGGIIGAGAMVISVFFSLILVTVLTVYFLISMERTKLFAYRLVPQSRRDRVVVLGEKIFTKVGGYVLGSAIAALIAGVGTFIWSLALGVPYPLLLGVGVTILDLVPVIGSTIGGAIVTVVALTVSLPVAIATLIFYIAYRLAEDYLIVPKIIGRTVEVPAIVSLIAVVIGGVLLGVVGALVAIPTAAAISLLLREVTFPRQDNSLFHMSI